MKPPSEPPSEWQGFTYGTGLGVCRLSQISRREWDEYDWHEVTVYGDPEPVYARGYRRVPPDPIIIKGQQRPGFPSIPRTEI